MTAFENEKTAAGQWQVLAKIQLGLIAAQDIGDEKMATAQVRKPKMSCFFVQEVFFLNLTLFVQRL